MVSVSGNGGVGGHEIPWQHFRVPEASVKGLGVFSTPLYLSRAGSELCHTVCAHCERGPAYSMLEIVHILLTLGEEARREGGREGVGKQVLEGKDAEMGISTRGLLKSAVDTHTHMHACVCTFCHLKMVNYHSTSPEASTDQDRLAGWLPSPEATFTEPSPLQNRSEPEQGPSTPGPAEV